MAAIQPAPTRSSRARTVVLALLAVLAVAVVIRTVQTFHDRLSTADPLEAHPRAVRVITVEPRAFEHTVVVSGTLEPVHSVDVFPKVGGKVVEMYVKLGDHVAEGDALARVEATEWGLQAEQAEVGLAMAEQAAGMAQRSLGRLEHVHQELGDGALSLQDFEEASIQAEGAVTQRDVARLQRDLARQMVRNATMRAPVSGVVSRIHARLGGMVGSEYPTFHVDDTSSLVLRCQVGDRELPAVAEGQEVRLASDAMPGRVLVGQVVAVAPTLDSITRRAPVDIAVRNPQGDITGNIFARGRIVTGREESAFVLPVEAVRRQRGSASVQLVLQGKVREVAVTVIGEGSDSVAVAGLEPGNAVALPGPEHLADGERVEPVDIAVGLEI